MHSAPRQVGRRGHVRTYLTNETGVCEQNSFLTVSESVQPDLNGKSSTVHLERNAISFCDDIYRTAGGNLCLPD
jgi:hypothetical protein